MGGCYFNSENQGEKNEDSLGGDTGNMTDIEKGEDAACLDDNIICERNIAENILRMKEKFEIICHQMESISEFMMRLRKVMLKRQKKE